ncbi:MAG: efflux transporter outer membrane subunit [Gammaproteobacteria bacterium]|nr:efflux transporter outer membrane subunit [Gammaproteobacteria bacterium]MBV9697920.1 efflux transporter outer membrane subunit [Gammaproteobacteria bacterium]
MRAPALLPCLALLSACAVGPRFHAPPAPAATDYGSAPVHGTTASSDVPGGQAQQFVLDGSVPADWWQRFGSPALDALETRALRNNPNVTAAQAALRQADELYKAQRASLFPALQGSFSAQRARNALLTLANPTSLPQQNPYYNLYTAQLSVSYLLDVWGGARRGLESAAAQAEAARFALEATYVTLTSNVAVTALQEAALRGQVEATQRQLEIQSQLTHMVDEQHRLGGASQLDLLTQAAAEAQTAALLPPLRKQLAQTRDALTALAGALPSDESAGRFVLDEFQLPRDLPVSVPARLIEQRPDVREALANLHAASAQVGVALADMLPQFELTGSLGSAALDLRSLFSPYTGFWSAGASLTQTLFDAGALLHRKRAADAALDEAGAQYRAAVLLACQNVADTLHALEIDADALVAAAAAEHTSHEALDIARQQRQLGGLSEVALLNAEQTYQQAVLNLIQARANRYADTVALFQALGGGWWQRGKGDPG